MLKTSGPALARYLAMLFTVCVVQTQASGPTAAAPSSTRDAKSGKAAVAATKAGQASTKNVPGPSTKSSATTPRPGKPSTQRDMWNVVDNVNNEALGGARNSHTYRSQSNTKRGNAKDSATIGKPRHSATGKHPTPPKKKKDD